MKVSPENLENLGMILLVVLLALIALINLDTAIKLKSILRSVKSQSLSEGTIVFYGLSNKDGKRTSGTDFIVYGLK
jgi:hypothetical protein